MRGSRPTKPAGSIWNDSGGRRVSCVRGARKARRGETGGGWLQWQFNLRKVEFAGVSAYFYGHGHPAAELKTRSV